MNEKLLEVLKELDMDNAEVQMALQCAPVITGLKISNLLIVARNSLERIVAILKGTCISYYILLSSADKVTIFLYSKERLIRYLQMTKVRSYLVKIGYKTETLLSCLHLFQMRYLKYMQNGDSFPHEMGLFLGYPLEDVCGFIENNGKNFLYNGAWKVYANVSAKAALFHRYETAKETLLQLVASGVGMADIIDIYNDNTLPKVAV